ncbi:MAG TPA: hypothetical protein DIW27_12950 [Cytophagales bacterium]|nr:hypothetical protein [Cytophagales bacterium]HRR09974.1 response regulator transcription factor [Rhodothermales bacterium]
MASLLIWLVDDNRDYLESTRDSLLLNEQVSEVICFKSSTEVTWAIEHDNELPDAILLDISMESKTAGIAAARQIKQRCPDVKILMLTAHDKNTDYGLLSFMAGADGFLSKDLPIDAVMESVLESLSGHVDIPASVAQQILENYKNIHHSINLILSKNDVYLVELSKVIKDVLPELTPTESRILAMNIQNPDKTDHEIADFAHVSVHTIHRHQANIKDKYELSSKVAVILDVLTKLLQLYYPEDKKV